MNPTTKLAMMFIVALGTIGTAAPAFAQSSLVRIAPRTGGLSLESSNNYEWIDKKSSGPKGSRTPDPRHVKALENEDVQKFEIEQMHNLSSYSSGGGVAREFKSCPPSPLSAENSTVC